MVSNSVLRIVVSPYFLASVHCPDLWFPSLCLCQNRLLILYLEQPLFKNLCRSLSVLVLTSLLLNKHAYPSRNVCSPACWVSFLHRLSSCSTWTSVLIFNILIINIKSKRNRWHNDHRYCGRMNTTFALCLRYSNNLMNSSLALHNFIAILSYDFKFEIFIPFWGNSLLNLTDNWDSPALTLGIGHKHFTDVFNKDCRLGTTCPGSKLEMNFWDFVIGVGSNE